MNGQDENVNLSRYLYFLLFLNNNLERWWCLMYEFQIQQRKREEVGEKKRGLQNIFCHKSKKNQSANSVLLSERCYGSTQASANSLVGLERGEN